MPDRIYPQFADAELVPGARNAIRVCLRLKREERITIITDGATRDIAGALQAEVEQIGSDYSLFVLEHHAHRPLKFIPELILEDLATSQVSVFAAQSQPGELGSRTQITTLVNNYRIRHAHMVDINRAIMCHGMRAHFDEIGCVVLPNVDGARKVTTTGTKQFDFVNDDGGQVHIRLARIRAF